MATIRPFLGLRFSSLAGPLEDLVAPPYDVLSPEERDRYAAKNPYNVVHLTLPEALPDDRSKFVKYARAAARLEQWRAEGRLVREERPSLYRYTQTFAVPGTDRVLDRQSLIVCIKVEPYEKGVVLPHEQTFPKHKEDRLRILEATRAHLESIYGLFEDDDQAVFQLIRGAAARPAIDVTTEDGVRHRLEIIDDPASVRPIAEALEPKKVWIADGHHRYETAWTFRQMQGDKDGEIAEDFMLIALSSISDPGLVLLPTHRILKSYPGSVDEIVMKLRACDLFDVSPEEPARLMPSLEREAASGQRAFGVALPGGRGFVLRVRDLDSLAARIEGTASERLKKLDVTILHEVIFRQVLGYSGHEFFDYTRDVEEALSAVEQGKPASFLMNPPTVDDMRHIALGGEKMPQKSTYYYPKILSGLVLWALADFDAS